MLTLMSWTFILTPEKVIEEGWDRPFQFLEVVILMDAVVL